MNILNQVLLEQFRVDAFIQAGGMGSVYRVWDLKRHVALAMKVLHADLEEEPLVLARFQREASLLQTLAHPHIVPFYGLMQGPGFSFLLERFIDGPSLKEILAARRGAPFSPAEALIYLKALASALGYAHNNGVIHCDIKPANVLLDQGGAIFLTDFGIARFADTTATTLRSVGTPAYMAPEQIAARSVSAPTDVYALGLLLFEMLSGQKPFRGSETIFETLPAAGQSTAERVRYAHLFLPPPDPCTLNPAIPPSLSAVILTALSKEPAARFQSAQALFSAACQAAQIDPANLPERAPLPSALQPANGAAPATIAPTSAPATIAPAQVPATQVYPPPYPPPGYPAFPPPAARKTLPAWAIALVASGALALVILLVVLLSSAPAAATPTPPPQSQASATPSTTPSATPTPTNLPFTPTHTPSPTPFDKSATPLPSTPPTATPLPGQATPALPKATVRQTGADYPQVRSLPDWNSDGLIYLPDGAQVWVTGLQSFDGSTIWAEVYFDYAGTYYSGWLPLENLPGEPNRIATNTPAPYGNYLLAYTSGPDGDWRIYLNDLAGSDYALPNQPANSGVPAWSPNHDWLAFRSRASGSWQVYKIRPDGSDLTQLTSLGNNYEPSWSPDGAHIAFVSDRDGNKEIYLMNANGSGQTRLTNNSVLDDDPSFSPFGDVLVFESRRDDHMDVYWLSLNDPSDQIPITSGGDYNGTPAWSPTGNHILYERGEGGQTHLWVIETSGWTTWQFTFNGTTNYRPAWSRDGASVAYTSDESGGWQVHVIGFYGGSAVPLASGYDPANGW